MGGLKVERVTEAHTGQRRLGQKAGEGMGTSGLESKGLETVSAVSVAGSVVTWETGCSALVEHDPEVE